MFEYVVPPQVTFPVCLWDTSHVNKPYKGAMHILRIRDAVLLYVNTTS